MIYLLTIKHKRVEYQWYVDAHNKLLYSVPTLNNASLLKSSVDMIELFFTETLNKDGEIRGFTYTELGKQLGNLTDKRVSQLVIDFCEKLNKTHHIPYNQRIDSSVLLGNKVTKSFQHTVETVGETLPEKEQNEIKHIKLMANLRNSKEGRAKKHIPSIFYLLSQFNKDFSYKTRAGIELPFIEIEHQGECPLKFPLTIINSPKKAEQREDSLFLQRQNSGRTLYNGAIFCLENDNGHYSLGTTSYMEVLDSCDYISSRIREHWVEIYEELLLNHISTYISDGIKDVFDINGEVFKFLNSLKFQYDKNSHRTLVQGDRDPRPVLGQVVRKELVPIIQKNLLANLEKELNKAIFSFVSKETKKSRSPLEMAIDMWSKRIYAIHNKDFSSYVAGIAFSIPLFQVNKESITVLLAKGSHKKATGGGYKHIAPAGMMEFFSDETPKQFTFDDFKALVCKELLEELYFGANIAHKKSTKYSRVIQMFSDNMEERTLVGYDEILSTVKDIVIPKWEEIWSELGKAPKAIPSPVLLEKVLNFKETDKPWFMVVDSLNSRPEIIRPIYFTENVEVFLNWENVQAEKETFSNIDDLEQFVRDNHIDFCAPGMASVYLGARYYFENQHEIHQNLGLV